MVTCLLNLLLSHQQWDFHNIMPPQYDFDMQVMRWNVTLSERCSQTCADTKHPTLWDFVLKEEPSQPHRALSVNFTCVYLPFVSTLYLAGKRSLSIQILFLVEHRDIGACTLFHRNVVW